MKIEKRNKLERWWKKQNSKSKIIIGMLKNTNRKNRENNIGNKMGKN